MIGVSEKAKIIEMHFDNYSNREIARILGRSKDTINKYIAEFHRKRKELLEQDTKMVNTKILNEFLDKPKYDSSNRTSTKITDEIIQMIKECLLENARKRVVGMSKQQMKIIDIHGYIKKEGVTISYSTIKRYIRKIETISKEAYIRQEYDLGDVCEFDWGEVKLFINGAIEVFQLAVFTAAKSNYRYAKLFRRQDTLAFQESHVDFFEHCGGTFRQLVYDNMRVAVKKFIGPSEKEPTKALLELSSYYGFKYRFCNVRRGNEKGHVERSVEVVRRKAFCEPGNDQFENLLQANAHLLSKCMEVNGQALSGTVISTDIFQLEKPLLLPLLPRLDISIKTYGTVDKYSCITVQQNHYSVLDTLVGKQVDVRIYANKIAVYHDGKQVGFHERSYGSHTWSIDINHYLRTLKRKNGALHQSTALLQVDTKIKNIYNSYYNLEPKYFLEVLEIINERGVDIVQKALEELAKLSITDMSPEKVKILCDKIDSNNENEVGTDTLSKIAENTLSHYDILRKLQKEAV